MHYTSPILSNSTFLNSKMRMFHGKVRFTDLVQLKVHGFMVWFLPDAKKIILLYLLLVLQKKISPLRPLLKRGKVEHSLYASMPYNVLAIVLFNFKSCMMSIHKKDCTILS